MLVLCHEMIPHHHHDLHEYGFSVQNYFSETHSHSDDFSRNHHNHRQHENGESNDSDQNHQKFPLHYHISADNSFDYNRVTLNSKADAGLIPILFVIHPVTLTPAPEIDLIRFTEIPFLIPAGIKPGAVGLRAPPSIA